MGIAERRQREREQRRQQIIDAAKKVFAARGFQGATMEEIASEAELSPATLYLYFKSKDELYASINVRILEYLILKTEAVQQRTDLSPVQKLHELKDALFSLYRFDPAMLMYVFHLQTSKDLKNLSPELLERITELSRRSMTAIAAVCEEGVKAGVFIKIHPIALADIIWGTFSGLVIWEESKTDLDPRKDYLKQTLDLAIEIVSKGISRA